MADNKGVDMKQFTEDGLLEISGLISRREYNRSIVRSRQLADRLVRSLATERSVEYTTLADTIERLYAAGAIDMSSRDDLHTIRIYGNKAVREADDSEEDAEAAYELIKKEVETYHARKQVSVERTPLRVERPSQRTRSESGTSSSSPRTRSASSRASSSGSRRKAESGSRGEITIYDVLKVLMPIIAVILLVIIIRSLLPSKSQSTPETTVSTVEETAGETEAPTEPETEAPTEPAPTLYEISGDNVNVRYADNQSRIYTQLSRGTYIGEVSEDVESTVAGVTFVKFTLDGTEVVVSKDYITPVTAEE